MTSERIVKEMEQRVSEWLTEQGARFTNDRERGFVQEFGIPSPDFLVFWPAPMTIDVSVASNGSAARRKSKRDLGRLLASQIWLSQRFGPYLPRVVIVAGEQDPTSHLFADSTISVDSLTTFDALVKHIQLNPLTQQILKHGQPTEIVGSTVSREAWEKPRNIPMWLSLESSTEPELAPPAGTLADSLHLATQAKRVETLSRPVTRRPGNRSIRPGNRRVRSDDERWKLSRELGNVIEQIILDYAAESVHAEIQSVTGHLDAPASFGRRRFQLLTLPNRDPILIRVMRVGGATFSHKLYELIADAWLDRASSPVPLGRQILLVGSLEPTGSALMKFAKELAQSGWHICPWDFDEPAPAFVELIREWADD